jgi:hypothetical protein
VDPARTVRYDEVTEHLPRVLTLRHEDGTGALLSTTPALHVIQRR